MFRVNGSKRKEWTYIHRSHSVAMGDSMEYAVIQWERALLLCYKTYISIHFFLLSQSPRWSLQHDTANPKCWSYISETGCKNLWKQWKFRVLISCIVLLSVKQFSYYTQKFCNTSFPDTDILFRPYSFIYVRNIFSPELTQFMKYYIRSQQSPCNRNFVSILNKNDVLIHNQLLHISDRK